VQSDGVKIGKIGLVAGAPQDKVCLDVCARAQRERAGLDQLDLIAMPLDPAEIGYQAPAAQK